MAVLGPVTRSFCGAGLSHHPPPWGSCRIHHHPADDGLNFEPPPFPAQHWRRVGGCKKKRLAPRRAGQVWTELPKIGEAVEGSGVSRVSLEPSIACAAVCSPFCLGVFFFSNSGSDGGGVEMEGNLACSSTMSTSLTVLGLHQQPTRLLTWSKPPRAWVQIVFLNLLPPPPHVCLFFFFVARRVASSWPHTSSRPPSVLAHKFFF